MKKYVCPECDFEQDTPGTCPSHNIELEEKDMPEMGGEEQTMSEDEEELDIENRAHDEDVEGEDRPEEEKENKNE